METLERLSRRIHSVEDLQSIVRTMKALSAASIRQYEESVRSLDDYYRSVELGLHVVLQDMEPVTAGRSIADRPLGVVVFGSDHGLCGRFNDQVVDHLVHWLDEQGRRAEDCRVAAMGVRADASLRMRDISLDESLFVPGSPEAVSTTVQALLVTIEGWQADGVEEVVLFFNRYESGRRYESTHAPLLPLDVHALREAETLRWPTHVLPTYRLPTRQLFSRLVREFLFVSLFRACASSLASEHGSRLQAMTSADRNIREHLEEARMAFQQRRQEAITDELLDVVSGFEAMGGESGWS